MPDEQQEKIAELLVHITALVSNSCAQPLTIPHSYHPSHVLRPSSTHLLSSRLSWPSMAPRKKEEWTYFHR